jgi:hypothetical protein
MPATFAEGGIAVGPKSGYAATLHGEEAVIPLENGSVPVDVSYEDLIAEIKALRYEVNAVGVKQVTYNKITADIINKWDRTGQPEQRDPV